MVRILSNDDLESACDMDNCLDALYQGLQAYSRGDAARRPRIELVTPGPQPDQVCLFSTMDGIIKGGYYAIRIRPEIVSWPKVMGVVRRKPYNTRPGLHGGLIFLFSTQDARLLAIMNDGFIQHMRVAAYEGLGARYLAREDTTTVGIIGSGGMARTFAWAYAAVRPVKLIKAYSPTKENLTAYCKEMSVKLGIEVRPMRNAKEVTRGSEIVAACTSSMEPVLLGSWLEPGMHIANVTGHETDKEAHSRVGVIGYLLDRRSLKLNDYSDDNFDVRMDGMAYLSGQPEERAIVPGNSPPETAATGPGGNTMSARLAPCVDWETGQLASGRTSEDITRLAAFRFGTGNASGGIQGVQFAAVAGRAYELAEAQDLGVKLPDEIFLQEIPSG